jgi:hypothetical protein
MDNETKLEEAVEKYERILENKGSGVLIIAAFTAISKWLRYEEEFKDIETWRKARSISQSLMATPDAYNLAPESLQEANDAGISLAETYFETGEIEKGYTFRSFMKKLGVFYLLNSQETGDLILCLLILRVVVENNEDLPLIDKYIKDIESICKSQLEGGEIYDDTLNTANLIIATQFTE